MDVQYGPRSSITVWHGMAWIGAEAFASFLGSFFFSYNTTPRSDARENVLVQHGTLHVTMASAKF